MDSIINSIIPSGLDPTMKGIITLWLITTVGYILRKYPSMFYSNIIDKYCFYSVTFNTVDGFTENTNRFNDKINELVKWQQSFRLTPMPTSKVIDYGSYMFFYKKALISVSIVNKEHKNQNGITNDNPVVTIKTLKWFRQQAEELLGTYTKKDDDFNRIRITTINGNTTERVGFEPLLDSKYWVVAKDVKNTLTHHAESFMNDKDFVSARGIPHRLTILLEGEPGTGKTTFAKVLASKYKMNIYLLNIANLTKVTDLVSALDHLEEPVIILIEDVDAMSSGALKKRKKGPGEAPDADASLGNTSLKETFNFGPSLSDVLNALDGIPSLHNKIIIMTTNHPEDLDPALLRPGRVNVRVTIGRLTSDLIHEYIQVMYPDHEYDKSLQFEPLRGCDLQGYLFFHRSNFDGFMQDMQKHVINKEILTIAAE